MKIAKKFICITLVVQLHASHIIGMELDPTEPCDLFHTDLQRNTGNFFALASTAVFCAQALGAMVLKRNNQFFGDGSIRESECKSLLVPVTMIASLGLGIPSSLVSSSMCERSLFLSLANSLMLFGGLVFLIARSYDHFTIKNYKRCIVDLRSIRTFDLDILKNKICAICLAQPNEDAVSLCGDERHVFCRSCMSEWLTKVNEDIVYEDNFIFKCAICRNDHNPQKVTVYKVRQTPTFKNIAWDMCGINGVWGLLLSVILMYNLTALVGHFL